MRLTAHWIIGPGIWVMGSHAPASLCPVVGLKQVLFPSVTAWGCCFPGGNPCPREPEEIQLLETTLVALVMFYGLGSGGRGEFDS